MPLPSPIPLARPSALPHHPADMMVRVTYYLEVIPSWCYRAEPAWTDLKRSYAGQPVEFDWKLALMDETGLPKSRAQLEWFYRRSGLIVRSPFMLNSEWYVPEAREYLAPNFVAQAARELGATDDRARLALATAALREGRKVGQWELAAQIAASATGLDTTRLLAVARASATERRARATTAEFHALQVTQRPAFVLESSIGDKAVFSGLAKSAPLSAAIDAMLEDAAAYAAHAAHFGPPPES